MNDIEIFNKNEKILAFVISFLAILSCSPVIFIGLNSILISGFVGVFLILFCFNFFKGKMYIRKEFLVVFLISFALFLYIAIPFRTYDRFSPSVIWFLLFCLILFFEDKILILAFDYFTNIIFVISLVALVVLFLTSFGVNLPSHTIPRDIGGYFTSYFVSVKLSGQEYSFLGLQFYRLNGIFAEPGHFGLLLTMVLFVKNEIVKTFKGKIILLTCFLTLSFGSFILLFGLFLKKIYFDRRFGLLIVLTLFVILLILFIPSEVAQRFFFDKADGAIDERTSDYFLSIYNRFYYEGDLLLGNGRDILEYFRIRNSDYRGFSIRYGYLGLLLYIFWMISMYFKRDGYVQFLGWFYFLIVFIHRSWFVDYFAFLFFLLIFSISYKYDKK